MNGLFLSSFHLINVWSHFLTYLLQEVYPKFRLLEDKRYPESFIFQFISEYHTRKILLLLQVPGYERRGLQLLMAKS
jgi:hypothetical protein